jgi:HD-GYP domain-containing protein (c-di-GMP phosphodiesterase class II)
MRAIIDQTSGEPHHLFVHLEEADRATLRSLLAALKVRDADTYNHSERSVCCSLLLGHECGLGAGQMLALELGALLHDIGKIGVPDSVLRKPGKLDSEEWATMRRHPDDGQRIVHGIGFLADATRVVIQHHEWWDGTGYPLGLRGEEIDPNARILAVADAFDAMTSDRIYRPAKSYEAAVAELDRCAGKQFDPQVVAAFHRVSRKEWRASPGVQLCSRDNLSDGR